MSTHRDYKTASLAVTNSLRLLPPANIPVKMDSWTRLKEQLNAMERPNLNDRLNNPPFLNMGVSNKENRHGPFEHPHNESLPKSLSALDFRYSEYSPDMIAAVLGTSTIRHSILAVAELDAVATARRLTGTESVILALLWSLGYHVWAPCVILPRSRRIVVYCRRQDGSIFNEASAWERIHPIVNFEFKQAVWVYEYLDDDIADFDVGPAAMIVFQKLLSYYANHICQVLEEEKDVEEVLALEAELEDAPLANGTAGPNKRKIEDITVAAFPTGAAPEDDIMRIRTRHYEMYLKHHTFMGQYVALAHNVIKDKLDASCSDAN